MSACCHCGGTRECRCFTCDGVCGFCLAREFNERHQHVLDKFDPGDPANWVRIPAANGNRGRRIYLPINGLK